MYYGVFCSQRRKTEPKLVFSLRALVMMLMLGFITVYILFLIKFLLDDSPVTQHTMAEVDRIPIPDMIFFFNHPFRLSCQFTKDEAESDESCNNYLIQPITVMEEEEGTDEENKGYYGCFINVDRISFVNSSDQDVIKSLSVDITSDEVSNSTDGEPPIVRFTTIDTVGNPVGCTNDEDGDFDNLPLNVRSVATENLSFLGGNQIAPVRFSRYIKRAIKSSALAFIGITPAYDEQPYVRTSMQSISTTPVTPPQFATKIDLSLQNFIVIEDTEQKTRTLFGLLGLVGGAYGIAAGIYTMLFGKELIRPWGCVQSCCGIKHVTHKELKKRLTTVPFIDPASLKMVQNPVLDHHIKELHNRLNSLETFLKEYVVDINYLETLKKINRHDDDQLDEPAEKVSPPTVNDHNTLPSSLTASLPNVQQQQQQQSPYNAPIHPEVHNSYGYPPYGQGSYPPNPQTSTNDYSY